MSNAEASTSASASTLPSLLPAGGVYLKSKWRPKTHNDPPRPSAFDLERINEPDMIANTAGIPGQPEFMRNPKKVRPRRTVDYNGGLIRWNLLRKIRPNGAYMPPLRPSPPYIINLLPPKAYPSNSSTSLATRFVHTSTNKIRFPINVLTWTPEGRRVLTGSHSGEFTLWNGLTFNFETILQAHDSPIRALEFSHSGGYLVSADQSGIIKYFQPNMNNVAAWTGHREAIRGLSYSPDDSKFVTCSDDQTIKLWAFNEMKEERTFTGHGWDVKCVQWHPAKGLLASGSKDNLVKFWDPRTGQSLSSLHYHKNTVQALSWNPNGDFLATASRDQTVRVFDIRAMKEFQVFKGHKKEVCSVAWHPVHHDLLVSGGAEGSLLYWLLSSPTPRAALDQAHDSNVWSLAWHPLGHILSSGSNDYTVRFWCRDRPGDISNNFRQGGEKPPAADAGDGEDDEYVPGFRSLGQNQNGAGGFGFGDSGPSFGGAGGGGFDGFGMDMGIGMGGGGAGVGALGNGPNGGPNGGDPWSGDGGSEGFIPGFGGGAASRAQSQPVPNPAASYVGSSNGLRDEEWDGGGRNPGYYGGRGGGVGGAGGGYRGRGRGGRRGGGWHDNESRY